MAIAPKTISDAAAIEKMLSAAFVWSLSMLARTIGTFGSIVCIVDRTRARNAGSGS
jgi:hypothetical protein